MTDTSLPERVDQKINTTRLNLKMALTLMDMDGTNVARMAGLSPNTLNTFLRGESSISYANLLRVCDVLKIPVSALHREEGISRARIRLWRLLEQMDERDLLALLESGGQ